MKSHKIFQLSPVTGLSFTLITPFAEVTDLRFDVSALILPGFEDLLKLLTNIQRIYFELNLFYHNLLNNITI